MANWKSIRMTLPHVFYSILDYIFPVAEPLSAEDQDRPRQRLLEDKAAIPALEPPLAAYLTVCQDLMDKQGERRQGVEARLTSILGLFSIAGTVAFGGFFLGSNSLSLIQPPLLRWLMTLAGCYLILQICAATLAAVRGLSRRGYDTLSLSDLTSRPGEPPDQSLHRKAERTLEVLSDHDTQNNAKVTQMAIAHCAMRNFLCGLLVFALLAVISTAKSGKSDELVDRLKQNHDLQQLLRGPQGPPGVAGPKGDSGVSGASRVPCTQPKQRKRRPRPPEQPCKAGQPDPNPQ